MDASFPDMAERRYLGSSVFAGSRIDLPSAGGDHVPGCNSHAQTPVLPHADHRPRWFWSIAGDDWTAFIRASGARPYSGHFLVQRESRSVHVFVHLVSRDVSALPLRSINESWMEGTAAAGHWRAYPDRSSGSVALVCSP